MNKSIDSTSFDSTSIDNSSIERAEAKIVSVADHYALNLYSSIYHLCFYIVSLSRVAGKTLESHFAKYPFLREYFDQIESVMPEELGWEEGAVWWRRSLIAMEENTELHLPLKALRENASLDNAGRIVLMFVGLLEEDSRFGTLISDLQQPISVRRPLLETLGNMARNVEPDKQRTAWNICEPLINIGLLQVENRDLPRSEWVLKANSQAWDLIQGNNTLSQNADPMRKSTWQFRSLDQSDGLDKLILEEGFLSKLRNLPAMVTAKRVQTIVLRAQEGSHSVDVLSAVANECGQSVIVIKQAKTDAAQTDESLGIICTMLNALPIFELDLGPGETFELPKLEGFTGTKAVILGEEGGLDGIDSEQVISLSLANPVPAQRAELWRKHLGLLQCSDLDLVSTQFRLPGDYIRQIAQLAKSDVTLENRNELTIDDVRIASRNLNRQKLDSLADALDAKGSWSQLITVESTSAKLAELQQRCRYREQLLDHLGSAFSNSSNCGVRALLTGRSGTGKTLATKILAAEVGMDIYRVDLASIVNKYIGETEKNLHKVLSRAEALDVILLLDEGDALMGARTDVKNANDRYANLETNYLLQRLENYQGVVLITTNLSDNIDKAFQRRMDIVIPFFQPQMEQRLGIFYLHLPKVHLIDHAYLEQAAKYCSLMGGQIRNVCLHASLLALENQQPVNNYHMEMALRSEYRKNGGTFPLDKNVNCEAADGGMQNFVNSLRFG